jgi:hypothetical protein
MQPGLLGSQFLLSNAEPSAAFTSDVLVRPKDDTYGPNVGISSQKHGIRAIRKRQLSNELGFLGTRPSGGLHLLCSRCPECRNTRLLRETI